MRSLSRSTPLLLVLSVASAAALALAPTSCSNASGAGDVPALGPGADDSSVAVDGGEAGAGGDGALFDVGDRGAPKSIKVDPPTAALLVTDPAAPPSVTLHALATFDDGSTTEVAASWTVDRYDLVTVSGSAGLVAATGKSGGNATVTATVGALTAKATVSVSLKLAVDPGGSVSAADKATLVGATAADPSVSKLLYPYDKTVFPKGLLGPEVMWNGGSAGDVYLLKITGPFAEIDLFGSANPPSVLPIDTALWNTLTTSVTSGAVESDVSVELRRASPGGKAYVSAKSTWHVADANVRGTIYYWAVDKGQVLKIKPGASTPVPVFDAGSSASIGAPAPVGGAGAPTPPWQDNGAGQRCIACHAVSKDGSRLTATFSTPMPRGSQGPDGFVDLKSGAVNAIGDYAQNGMFSTLTPNGLKSVVNTVDQRMHLLDATSGAAIGSALDGLSGVADGAFSNDGKMFALAANIPGGNPVEFSASDLVVYDFDDPSNAFSGLRTIVKGSGASDSLAFPSFSPDSKWLFFQRGNYSRAKYGANAHGVDNLYAVAATPGATPMALDALNGKGVLTGDNVDLNYQPTVNPIAEGGYFWVVFVSPRDYGNKMVSPQKTAPGDCTYSNRKQLWVAAVDASMKGPDPSHPAFRLPGQLLETINMNGYWTLEPCLATPKDGSIASCSAGFECCSGFCRDVAGKATCVDPPSGCHHSGEKCTTDGDCCDGGACIGGFCGKKGPS